MIQISIDASQLKNVSGYIRKLPRATDRGMWLATLKVAQYIRQMAIARRHVGANKGMSTTKGTRAVKLGKGKYGIVMPGYTEWMETGSPGLAGKWIPSDDVKFNAWCKAKGVNPFAVRKAIQQKGVYQHPFVLDAIRAAMSDVLQILEKHTAPRKTRS